MKILQPSNGEKVYAIAAKEFQRMYYEITGIKLEIAESTDENESVIVIGNDCVNEFSHQALTRKMLYSFNIRYGTDDYSIISKHNRNRDVLFIAGGRGRSTLYAVYHFFEKQAGCHYFWDGDVIPKLEEVDITGLHIVESPRFEYRGLRYFAHRGLHRFQAEHWSIEDWQREINWLVKKRLNLFMLRIGIDDIFQLAFPDVVDYPPEEGVLPEAGEGYDDRTLFWSLKYRGELRKKILSYARERDLIHPEDCGTMTHWYSRTPQQFLDKVEPDFIPQTSTVYRQPTGLVWDIRQKKNLNNYFKLTKTHMAEYGSSEMFHTIGLAERLCSEDREENMYFKLFTYRKIAEFLQREYNHAPLLISSWDFAMYWNTDEVKNLVSELNPQQSIVFDYTSDTTDEENNFINWGIVGKYPWIFGIFHAFEPNSDIRGNYDLIAKRLKYAADDSFCKGMVIWPELSHSDTFMLEYMTSNSWSPDKLDGESFIPDFCNKRYAENAQPMEKIWKKFFPLVKLGCWRFDRARPEYELYREYFFDILQAPQLQRINDKDIQVWEYFLGMVQPFWNNVIDVIKFIIDLNEDMYNQQFIRRDTIDILRTIIGRCVNYGIMSLGKMVALWRNNQMDEQSIKKQCDSCLALIELLGDLLGMHEDYSMNETLKRLKSTSKVNPLFENTLKNNVADSYCRTYNYELVKYLCVPEAKFYFSWLLNEVNNNKRQGWSEKPEFAQRKKEFMSNFKKNSLSSMDSFRKPEWKPLIKEIYCAAKNVRII